MTVAIICNTSLDNRQYTDDRCRTDCFAVGAHWTVNNLYHDFQKRRIPFDVYAHFNYKQKNKNISDLRRKLVNDFQLTQTWSNDFNEIEQIFLKRHGLDISTKKLKNVHWQFYRLVMQFYWFFDTSYRVIQQNDIYTHFLKWRPDSIWKISPDSDYMLKNFIFGGFKINTGYESTQAGARVPNISLVPGLDGNQTMVADQYYCLDREAILRVYDILDEWVKYTYQLLIDIQNIEANFIYPETFFGKLLSMAKIHVSTFDTYCQQLIRPSWFEKSTVTQINSFSDADPNRMEEFFKFLNNKNK